MKLDNRVKMPALILKRASASRPSGEWSDDYFDVLADGVVVGRVFKAEAAPKVRTKPARARGDENRPQLSLTVPRLRTLHHGSRCVLD
jgi:hypothetical protein